MGDSASNTYPPLAHAGGVYSGQGGAFIHREFGVMKSSKAQELARRIDAHGKSLLRIFPNATEQDPANLCKKLRRVELMGAAFALRLCNGPEFASEEEVELEGDRILAAAYKILRPEGVPLFLNRDPRGHALKIRSEWTQEHAPTMYRDWGGYGIIAPDLRED